MEDILIEGENVVSSITESNFSVIATDKRLIIYIKRIRSFEVADLSYDVISSIRLFFKYSQKQYFWLSALGLFLVLISIASTAVTKTASNNVWILFAIGVVLFIFGIIFKKTEKYIGLELFGRELPERTKVRTWSFNFKNKDVNDVLEFMKVIRSMVNYYRHLVILGKD